jgi:voltage-gated potassium channel Kch
MVVDVSSRATAEAQQEGCSIVRGDARSVATLRVAGTGTTYDVIVCVPDADAAAVVASVRSIEPHARIHVAVRMHESEAQVMAAGANDAVMVGRVAGRLLAQSISSATSGNPQQ